MTITKFFASVKQTASNFFFHPSHTAPQAITPIPEIPLDVIGLFFSLLNTQGKAAFGRTCKGLNAAYMRYSPFNSLCKRLYTDLDKIAADLATATQKRQLTSNERYQLGDLLTSAYHPYHEEMSKAEHKLDDFYNVFTSTLTASKVPFDRENYSAFHRLAHQKIKSSFEKRVENKMKLETVINEFDERSYNELVSIYTSQPLDAITIDNFKEQIAIIETCFPNMFAYTIETERFLRRGIQSRRSIADFDTIAHEYSTLAPDSPRFIAFRADLEAKLAAEKNALETELASLSGFVEKHRGDRGMDETIDAACEATQQAEIELNQAYTALTTAFAETVHPLPVSIRDREEAIQYMSVYFDAEITSGAAARRHDYQQKAEAFNEKKEVEDIVIRFNQIAQYNGTIPRAGRFCEFGLCEAKQNRSEAFRTSETIVEQQVEREGSILQSRSQSKFTKTDGERYTLSGGRLHEVNANLEPAALDEAVRSKAAKIAAFYGELKKIVGDDNKVALSHDLHQIID